MCSVCSVFGFPHFSRFPNLPILHSLFKSGASLGANFVHEFTALAEFVELALGKFFVEFFAEFLAGFLSEVLAECLVEFRPSFWPILCPFADFALCPGSPS